MKNTYNKISQFLRFHQENVGRFLSAHGASEYTILIIFSVILGSVAGFVAVSFHETVEIVTKFLKSMDNNLLPPWHYLVIGFPVLGMFIQWIMRKIAPGETNKRGVTEIIKAVSLRSGDISVKSTLFHFFAPIICIGTGGTVGPEAPVAQTGAGVVSNIGKLLGFSDSRLRIFATAGAGAAIAGVFNTPLAGIFFCVEVILLNEFRASTLSVFLLTSVSASAVSRAFLGNAPKFVFGQLQYQSLHHLGFFLLLGLSAGLLSILFIRANEYFEKIFARIYKKVPVLLGMICIGLLMGISGYFFPEILGIGYKTINTILAGNINFSSVLLLFLLKFILVILILASGGFGGIFAPSIFMGACYGYLFALVISSITPLSLDPTTYTLVGMGAMLAGVNSVPITAILILFEMTNDYHFILPLMMGVVGSHVFSHVVLNGSLYQRKLQRAGYLQTANAENSILQTTLVEQVTRMDILAVPESTPVSELVYKLLEEQRDTVYTTGENGRINGVIPSSTLRHLITDFHNLREFVIAKDIADPHVTLIDAKSNLEEAIRIFAQRRVEEIPVIQKYDENKIIGTLHYQDVMNAYNQGMVNSSFKQSLANDFKKLQKEEILETIPGFSIGEVTIPNKYIGKKLGEVNFRKRFKINILTVERSQDALDDNEFKRLFPDYNFIFNRGDKLIVYGSTLDIINFKNSIGD